MLAPAKNFVRTFPLYDAVVHFRIQPLIATEIGVERTKLEAFVPDYVRYFRSGV